MILTQCLQTIFSIMHSAFLRTNNYLIVVRTLEKAKAAGITAGEFTGASLLEGTGHLAKIKTESVSSFDGVSDSDSVSDVDGMANGSSAGSSSGSLIGKKRGASNGQSTKRIKSANTSESMSALTNSVM